MSVSGLKAELRLLESIFGKEHERFRIISWRLDELHCVFIQSTGGALTIHCNITVSVRSEGRPHRMGCIPQLCLMGEHCLPGGKLRAGGVGRV